MTCAHFCASASVEKNPMCRYRYWLPSACRARLMKNLNCASGVFCGGSIEIGASRRQRVSMKAPTLVETSAACGPAACFVVGVIALPGSTRSAGAGHEQNEVHPARLSVRECGNPAVVDLRL